MRIPVLKALSRIVFPQLTHNNGKWGMFAPGIGGSTSGKATGHPTSHVCSPHMGHGWESFPSPQFALSHVIAALTNALLRASAAAICSCVDTR